MASWWLERVLLHPPGDTDTEGAYWREVVWVLEWLVAGLKTNDDFDNLRRNGVYEKCMALFFHPSLDNRRFSDLVVDEGALERETGLQAKVRPLVVRLVVRGSLAGGATILVTGMGVLAWLGDVGNVVAGNERAVGIVEGARGLILARAEKEKMKEWSYGTLL
jgi:nucleolar pre-ribosomal-associated protein 1